MQDLAKQKWTLQSLLKGVEEKFGTTIDLVHLVARLMASIDLLDDMQPLFIGNPPKKKELKEYFKSISTQHLKKQILE